MFCDVEWTDHLRLYDQAFFSSPDDGSCVETELKAQREVMLNTFLQKKDAFQCMKSITSYLQTTQNMVYQCIIFVSSRHFLQLWYKCKSWTLKSVGGLFAVDCQTRSMHWYQVVDRFLVIARNLIDREAAASAFLPPLRRRRWTRRARYFHKCIQLEWH